MVKIDMFSYLSRWWYDFASLALIHVFQTPQWLPPSSGVVWFLYFRLVCMCSDCDGWFHLKSRYLI